MLGENHMKEEDRKTPLVDRHFLLLLKNMLVQKIPCWSVSDGSHTLFSGPYLMNAGPQASELELEMEE